MSCAHTVDMQGEPTQVGIEYDGAWIRAAACASTRAGDVEVLAVLAHGLKAELEALARNPACSGSAHP